jgi:predicted PurR-regulated permease PerM
MPDAERSADRRWLLVRHPLAIAAGTLGLVALLLGLWVIRDVLLLGFLAVLIAVVFTFPVDWLSRRLPRGLSVVLVLVAVLGGIGALGWLAVPPLATQGKHLAQTVPTAMKNARAWVARTARASQLGERPKELTRKVQEHATNVAGDLAKQAIPAALSTVELIATAVLLLVMGAFLAHAPHAYRDALRTLVPPSFEPHFDETWRRMAQGLRHWVGGIVVSMFLMGSFTAVGLWLAGIEGWPLLAILTFLGTFVPYLGAIASAVPGLVIGLAQSPVKLFSAAGVYLAVHIVEGYIVQPLVMKRAVEIRPATLLFGQVAAGALFGVLGTVVATPMIVCLKAAVGYLWIERRLGKDGPRP